MSNTATSVFFSIEKILRKWDYSPQHILSHFKLKETQNLPPGKGHGRHIYLLFILPVSNGSLEILSHSSKNLGITIFRQ